MAFEYGTVVFGDVTYNLVKTGTSALYISKLSTPENPDDMVASSPRPDTRHGLKSRKKFSVKFSRSIPINTCEGICSGINEALIGNVEFSIPLKATEVQFETLRKVMEGLITDVDYLARLRIGGY